MQMKRLSYIDSGIEPVSLAEGKRQCFVTSNADDELIERLIRAAREYAEKELWRAVTPAKYIAFSDSFPVEIELPYPPIIDVEKVEYMKPGGTLTELDAGEYVVDDLSDIGRIKPVNRWPDVANGTYNAVRITYRAGYLDEPEGEAAPTNNAPETIKHAILMMVKHFYDNPEAVIAEGGGITVHEVPKGVDDLLNQESARVFV